MANPLYLQILCCTRIAWPYRMTNVQATLCGVWTLWELAGIHPGHQSIRSHTLFRVTHSHHRSNLQPPIYVDVFRLWEKTGVTTGHPWRHWDYMRTCNSLYKPLHQTKDAAEDKVWKASSFAGDLTSERSQDVTVKGLLTVKKHERTHTLMSGTRLCWFEL